MDAVIKLIEQAGQSIPSALWPWGAQGAKGQIVIDRARAVKAASAAILYLASQIRLIFTPSHTGRTETHD
jgi:hypothetical protein